MSKIIDRKEHFYDLLNKNMTSDFKQDTDLSAEQRIKNIKP